ncbi:hypothetical protein AMST5_00818 [freshwater sediment metagenome]|uniref:Predicted 3'-5' exonuclease PolB-like domain-containing protein n=1 Tax=freshwater sediment metagenome TaxID=556182 RepID=A0AA48LXL9_9ZZZZ
MTFNGNGFDLPLLRYRAFALGVPVPGLHGGGHCNYWHRFGSDHIDLCDVLSGYGASTKPSLAEMAALANIRLRSEASMAVRSRLSWDCATGCLEIPSLRAHASWYSHLTSFRVGSPLVVDLDQHGADESR